MATLSTRRTELAKGFNLGLQDVLIVLVAIFDRKEDGIQLADCANVLMGQRRE